MILSRNISSKGFIGTSSANAVNQGSGGLPLGQDQLWSWWWGLCHQEPACMADTDAWTLLRECALGLAARQIREPCRNERTQLTVGRKAPGHTQPRPAGQACPAAWPQPAASLHEGDWPQPFSAAPSAFLRTKRTSILPRLTVLPTQDSGAESGHPLPYKVRLSLHLQIH